MTKPNPNEYIEMVKANDIEKANAFLDEHFTNEDGSANEDGVKAFAQEVVAIVAKDIEAESVAMEAEAKAAEAGTTEVVDEDTNNATDEQAVEVSEEV